MNEELSGAETLFLREYVARTEKELGRKLGVQEVELIKMNLGLTPASGGVESTLNSLEHSARVAELLRRKKSQKRLKRPLNALKNAAVKGIREREGD